eukprot:10909946-Karenia_brevis.AAC.1
MFHHYCVTGTARLATTHGHYPHALQLHPGLSKDIWLTQAVDTTWCLNARSDKQLGDWQAYTFNP